MSLVFCENNKKKIVCFHRFSCESVNLEEFAMTELKTQESLLKSLRTVAARKLTQEELYKQRVSFIMGSLSDSSTLTRAQVTKALADIEGRKSA